MEETAENDTAARGRNQRAQDRAGKQDAAHVVVGGGIIGMATALELCGDGTPTTLVERNLAGREASWAGGGILSPLPPWDYPDPVSRLADESLALYPGWVGEIERLSGTDCEHHRTGMLVLPPHDRGRAEEWLRARRRPHAVVDSRAVDPGVAPHDGCTLVEDVHQVRNPRLIEALRGALARRGVRILDGAEIAGIDPRARRVRALVAADGTRVAGETFVVCAGAWSARLLERTSAAPPIRPVRGQVLLYRLPPEEAPRRIVLRGDFYLIPRRDGHVLAGSTIEEAGFDRSVTPGALRELGRKAREVFPALDGRGPVRSWAGLRPGSPDDLPVIDRHPDFDNLYVHAGHYRYGLTMAPASARILARVVKGDAGAEAEPYRIARRG